MTSAACPLGDQIARQAEERAARGVWGPRGARGAGVGSSLAAGPHVSRSQEGARMGQVSPAARGLEPDILARRGLLLVVGATAVTGVLAGLSRAGVVAAWGPRYGAAHGPLFVLGVFGTLIALERAVALGRTWAFLAPVAGRLGLRRDPGRSRLRAVGARALGGGARRGQHRHRAPAARCVHVHHAGRVDGPVRRLPDVGHGAAPPRRGPRLDVVLRPHDRRRAGWSSHGSRPRRGGRRARSWASP
jgi:hypothetical protein